MKAQKELYNISKSKYTLILLLLIVSSFLITIWTRQFILENPDIPTIFCILGAQIISVIMYVYIRLTYKVELLVIELNTNKNNRELFKNKFSNFIGFFIIQFVLSILETALLSKNLTSFYLIIFINILTIILMTLIYIIDFSMINQFKYNKICVYWNYSIIFCGFILFYHPNYVIALLVLMFLCIGIPINYFRIYKEL